MNDTACQAWNFQVSDQEIMPATLQAILHLLQCLIFSHIFRVLFHKYRVLPASLHK